MTAHARPRTRAVTIAVAVALSACSNTDDTSRTTSAPTTTIDPAIADCTDQATQDVVEFWTTGDRNVLVLRYGYGSTSVDKAVHILSGTTELITPGSFTSQQVLAAISVLAGERCAVDPAFRADVLAAET